MIEYIVLTAKYSAETEAHKAKWFLDRAHYQKAVCVSLLWPYVFSIRLLVLACALAWILTKSHSTPQLYEW